MAYKDAEAQRIKQAEYRAANRASINEKQRLRGAGYRTRNKERLRDYQANYVSEIHSPRLEDIRARLEYVMDEVFHTDAQRRKFVRALVDRGTRSLRGVLYNTNFDLNYIAPYYEEIAA